MRVLILGTRGIPAGHGGFETFAQNLSLYLKARNHDVTVYCQTESGADIVEDRWNGVRRVLIPAKKGALGTVLFDYAAIRHSCQEKGVVLTLGYNTGLFSFLYRLHGIQSVMNMDGIEWRREKWSRLQRAWLWFNERAGARAANHLVADHPEIGLHLQRHTPADKITVIPYGADPVLSAPVGLIQKYGLTPKKYDILIARPEPENSVLEIVRTYSLRRRGMQLVVLGTYSKSNPYHKKVLDAAGPEVKFPGAIYHPDTVSALRFHSRIYFHGHTVGGTNPSLVEALAAGSAVVAHDNPFNRWVAGAKALFFEKCEDLAEILDSLEGDPKQLIDMQQGSRERHHESFMQSKLLSAYERLLMSLHIPTRLSAEETMAGK